MYSYFYETKIGRIGLVERDGCITKLYLGEFKLSTDLVISETTLLKEAAYQLQSYLVGELKEFKLPLAVEGSAFLKIVLAKVAEVPYGQTATYQEIAIKVGKPKAARAVGQANHRNPLPIVIPCHRVIGAKGVLTGYGGGLELKQFLLELEQGRRENFLK